MRMSTRQGQGSCTSLDPNPAAVRKKTLIFDEEDKEVCVVEPKITFHGSRYVGNRNAKNRVQRSNSSIVTKIPVFCLVIKCRLQSCEGKREGIVS